MVNSVINAITKQLGDYYGKSYRYYKEDVEQDLKKPCFTVAPLIPITRSKSPTLYERTIPIVVHYFNDGKQEIKNEYYDMGEQIIECLEYLQLGSSIIRGEDISWQTVDDVLQLFITYRFTTRKVVEPEETIDTLENRVSHS